MLTKFSLMSLRRRHDNIKMEKVKHGWRIGFFWLRIMDFRVL